MKIVELGHTGVGKTTYMSALYETLQKPVEGFSLKAAAREDHQRFLLLADKIKKGEYPAPTDQRREYNFNLQYLARDIFGFDWSDYRGGALLEAQENQQAQVLAQDLQTADGILLFCDSQALLAKNPRQTQLGRMINLVNYALNNRPYQPLSLVIVLTKADLVTQVDSQMLAPLQSLIEAIKLSNSVKGAIVPIACGPKAINIEIPLLFLLNTGVKLKVNNLRRQILTHETMAKIYQEKSQGFFGFIRDAWLAMMDGESYGSKFEQEKKHSELKFNEYNKILEPVKQLSKYLSDADLKSQLSRDFSMLIN